MYSQLKISIGEYSSKGRKELNQDFHDIRIPKEPQLTNKGIAIGLADGISSSDVSQIASKVTVTSFLTDYFSTPDSWSVKKSAERVLNATNAWLNSQSKQGQYHYDKDRGYVCTFSGMILRSTTAYIFHVGDARIYRLRDTTIEQLTEDHRLWITRDKSYLSRAMGMDTKLSTDFGTFQIEKDDIYLFMTDGVYEFVKTELMVEALQSNPDDLAGVAQSIVDKAYSEGSDDNLTLQIVRVDQLPTKDLHDIHQQLTKKPFPPLLDAREHFDGYTIVRVLSASSRSHVYLAVDDQTQTKVVLKMPSIDLQDDKAYLERFMMEEWIAIRINSPYVVKSYIPTRKRNFLYNVTEYIEGQTLTQWMIDHPHPALEIVREITLQIARGLYTLHKQEMIHQDLRPENILIDSTGTVKIIDLGSVRVEGITDINMYLEQESLLGTALYSAPEYFLGKIGTPKSDLFALATIVYEMLTGHYPYGVNMARCKSKSEQKKLKYTPAYQYNPTVAIWIDESLKKALQVDPYNRYDELSEFLYDLRHPNKNFINKKEAPLLERNPVLFWKSVSITLMGIIIFLVSK